MQTKKAPFFKVLEGMPIAVDAFQYGAIPDVEAYFLTHAHSDHYTNLASDWKGGPIYCSQVTSNLVIHMLCVDPKWVHALPMDIPTVIPNTGSVQVTLIEANHCPGSCLFLFEGQQTVNCGDSAFRSALVRSTKSYRYLHCGDFRASPQHVLHSAIQGKKIDIIYLDTTYLDPKYTFPPQPLVISSCVELVRRIAAGRSLPLCGMNVQTLDTWLTRKNPSTRQESVERILVVIGTYSIGKERIVKAIAQALQTKIYCDERKAAILRCENDPELQAMLTCDPCDAAVHIVPLHVITRDKLQMYAGRFKKAFSKVVGFRPTGWTYTHRYGVTQHSSVASVISFSQQRTFTYMNLCPMRGSTPTLLLFGVPYSEHSSFFELTCFALSLNWDKIIATVNVSSDIARGNMVKWFDKWKAGRQNKGVDEVVPYRANDYW